VVYVPLRNQNGGCRHRSRLAGGLRPNTLVANPVRTQKSVGRGAYRSGILVDILPDKVPIILEVVDGFVLTGVQNGSGTESAGKR